MLGIFQCCYFVGVHIQSFLWSNLVHVWYDMKFFCLYTNLAAPSQDDHEICNLKRAIKCFTWKFVDAPPHCWLLVCTLPQLSSTRLFSIGFFCAPALEVFFPPFIPSASRQSGFELSCTPSWEVCLVPFSTFVQHFSFFYGPGFLFFMGLKPLP